ncbi:MAG: acyltransferase family protein, partial [Acidimicrobiia bacterium]
VLLFHGGFLTGGYLGVDLFFVLSGFLITSLLLEESAATGRIGLGSFWARRARRLLPAMAGVLVGVAVYCAVFASPAELAQIRDGDPPPGRFPLPRPGLATAVRARADLLRRVPLALACVRRPRRAAHGAR